MTPQDLRMKYNKETGNETWPSFSADFDYTKWLEEELIRMNEQLKETYKNKYGG